MLLGMHNFHVDDCTDLIVAHSLALSFYCIGSLDILELLNEKVNTITRNEWRKWFWEQQTSTPHVSMTSHTRTYIGRPQAGLTVVVSNPVPS